MGASKELAEILAQRNATKYKAIIDRAALNGYHDFKFDAIPGHPEYGECVCPKMQLVADLSAFPELEDIRVRVINGDFDDAPDGEDDEIMRGWLMDDEAGDGMFNAIGLKPPTKEEREQRRKSKLSN